jgi:hypothetical protein
MNALPPLPAHLWPLTALCALAFVVLWWLVLGAGRFARRRVLRLRIAALGETDGTPRAASPSTLARPLASRYDIPSFLFIGDASASVPAVLAAANGAPVVAVRADAVVLDASANPQGRSQWYRTLLALSDQRQRLPLNGIVLCVDASSLREGAPIMAPVAARMRHLVENAAEHLQLHLPVYLVVTGLERLPGYKVFREALPREVLDQALGHRLQANAAPGASTGALLDELFQQITLRMHALRMALLCVRNEPGARRDIHAFVEEVHAMRAGLHVLAHGVFDNTAGPWPPHWRGLYLTAAPSGSGAGAFASDLFERFLPADQPLAHA